MSRVRTHLLAALLIVATFAAAVLPPFVHVYLHDHSKDGHSLQACSHYGVKLVHLPRMADEMASEPTQSQLEHCPFCTQHASHALPAVIVFTEAAADTTADFVPPYSLWAPRPLIAWLMPASRAPPSQLS